MKQNIISIIIGVVITLAAVYGFNQYNIHTHPKLMLDQMAADITDDMNTANAKLEKLRALQLSQGLIKPTDPILQLRIAQIRPSTNTTSGLAPVKK